MTHHRAPPSSTSLASGWEPLTRIPAFPAPRPSPVRASNHARGAPGNPASRHGWGGAVGPRLGGLRNENACLMLNATKFAETVKSGEGPQETVILWQYGPSSTRLRLTRQHKPQQVETIPSSRQPPSSRAGPRDARTGLTLATPGTTTHARKRRARPVVRRRSYQPPTEPSRSHQPSEGQGRHQQQADRPGESPPPTFRRAGMPQASPPGAARVPRPRSATTRPAGSSPDSRQGEAGRGRLSAGRRKSASPGEGTRRSLYISPQPSIVGSKRRQLSPCGDDPAPVAQTVPWRPQMRERRGRRASAAARRRVFGRERGAQLRNGGSCRSPLKTKTG